MTKWNVHLGMRLTYDVEVEADTKEEAIEKANDIWQEAKYKDMDYAGSDIDVWEIE